MSSLVIIVDVDDAIVDDDVVAAPMEGSDPFVNDLDLLL